jgi:hypothetical protein
MGHAPPGEVVVVVERLKTAAGDRAMDVAAQLARHGLHADVAALGPHPAFATAARQRRFLRPRRAVRVRDLLAETARPALVAVDAENGTGDAPRWLDSMAHRPAVEVPTSLASHDVPDRFLPIRVQEETATDGTVQVRVRIDPQGRPYQHEHLDPAGRAVAVTWLDPDSGAATAILLFDHTAGTVSRFSPVRAAARLLGPSPRVVVAVDAFGDRVGRVKGVPWTLVPSGDDVVDRAVAAARAAA